MQHQHSTGVNILSYTHLTLIERESLQELHEKGYSIRKIAKILGRSPSTISRELKRNFSKRRKHYRSWGAHVKYLSRRKNCHRKNNLLIYTDIYNYVFDKLLSFWSPEIIAKTWNINHNIKISFSSIYRGIYDNLFPGITAKSHLRRRGRPYITERKSYTKHPDKSIHNRDSVVDERGRFGDYEGDTIYGSVGKGYLVIAIDRKSRYLVAATCKDKSILSINEAFREAFEKASLKIKPLTLTLDNGSEFNGYADIEKDLDLEIYFADVHAPWQRGSNENINGLLRFFFPRGTDFRKITRVQLDAVLDKINNRPRKCLDLLSPIDYFYQSVALGLTI